MNRSRYSATMSRCLGSANQSRDRKRIFSDAMGHDFLWKSRHVNPYLEQSPGQWLLTALLGTERDVRGCDVQSPQIVTSKRCLGDGGAGQAESAEQLPCGRIALQAPTPEYTGPEAALRVHDGA